MTYTKEFTAFLETGEGSEAFEYMAWKVAEDAGVFDAALNGRLEFNLIYNEPIVLSEMTIGQLEDLGDAFYRVYEKIEARDV